MYKPLPESLTIKTSKVNGLGLFAKEGIAQGTNLGMTHIKVADHLIRTPLGGFLKTTSSFRSRLPSTALVLPSHNEPFFGLHDRLVELIEHHKKRLDEMAGLCIRSSSAYSITTKAFSPDLDSLQLSLALTETLAHLNHMVSKGRLTRNIDNNGIWAFKNT